MTAAVACHHRLTPADRGYCCLPLFHVNAEVVGLLATLAAGACLVLDRTFSRRGFWPMIEARAEGDRLVEIYPQLADLARENRAFIIRAVTMAADLGIGQFIDLGAGLPASPAVHQAARKVMPKARVAYVDTDHAVLSHARALLATSDGVTAAEADLRDPAAVLGHPHLRAVIDPARPVCVILGAVLQFMDADAARAVTAGYISLMAPGSYLIISWASLDDPALAKQLSAEYTPATWHNHPAEVIGSFFGGLERAGPGLTEAQTWRPWLTEPVPCHRDGHVLAGVARLGDA